MNHSDSGTAILALTVRTRLVKECLDLLSLASSYYTITLVWVPVNCEADKPVSTGTSMCQ